MKKLIIIGMSLCLAVTSMVACGKKESSDDVGRVEEETGKRKDSKKLKKDKTTDNEKYEQYKKAAVVYINGHKIDLDTWKDMGIDEIVDEISSTGLKFTSISGTKTHDSEYRDVNIDEVKTAFRDINTDNEYPILTINMSNEIYNEYELIYHVESKSLDFEVSALALKNDDFAIGDKKYNCDYLLELKDNKQCEKFMKESGMFSEVSEYSADNLNMSTSIYDVGSVEYQTYGTYSFSISNYDIKIIADELSENTTEASTDVQEVKNRLGVIQYDGKELDFGNFIDMKSTEEIVKQIQDFGFNGLKVTVIDSSGEKDTGENFESEDFKEIAKKFDEALKNKTTDYFVKLYGYLNKDSSDEYEVGIIYGFSYFDGKLFSEEVVIERNFAYSSEAKELVTYTTDRLNFDDTLKNKENVQKMVSGLTHKGLREYYLTDQKVEVVVEGNADYGQFDRIVIRNHVED